MLEKLTEILADKVAAMASKGAQLKELVAADPVAAVTQWTPLRHGGRSALRTHKLVQESPDLLELRVSLQSWLFHLVWIGAGVAAVVYSLVRPGVLSTSESGRLIVAVIGLAIALWILYQFSGACAPVCFDMRAGVMRRGWSRAGGSVIPLPEIHALQIIQEQCESSKASKQRVRYMSYELNVVRKDGSRLNLLDQRGRTGVQDDARRIADFLGIPLWDMSSI
jgi:hypothetical protein